MLIVDLVYFYLFVALSAIQLSYLFFFSGLLFKKKHSKPLKKALQPVSVILYVRNNWAALADNLESILHQRYPKFEVIVVDNESTDETCEEIENLQKRYDNLRLVEVENNEAFWANKKYALTLGIKSASFNSLVLTTPFVKATSDHWLESLVQNFSENKTLIIGTSRKVYQSKFLTLIGSFDNFMLSLFSLNYAMAGKALYAWDNNFAFKKSEFFRVKGFIFHVRNQLSVSSLFLHDANHKQNITVSWEEKTTVDHHSKEGFRDWIQEKKTRFEIFSRSKLGVKLSLFFFYFTRFLFYIMGGILLYSEYNLATLWIIGGLYLLSLLVYFFLLKGKKEMKLLFFLPLLDPIHLLIEILIFIVSFLSKKKD